MTWAEDAATLLAAAAGADLTAPVAREVVAPGPGVARDCRMIAVWLDSIDPVQAGVAELPGGSCTLLAVTNLRVLFVADCVPTPSDTGTPPTAQAVTDWTLDYLADVQAVWNAVADAAANGDLGECSAVSVGSTQQTGPLGGTASTIIPVRIGQLAASLA